MKWSACLHLFPSIEQRDNAPFKDAPGAPRAGPAQLPATLSFPQLCRVTPADVSATDLARLLPGGKHPRRYQLELFCRAATWHSLVFLPTGSGKTLVAAMVVRRVRERNPGRVAVFLADRIPLVHQQAEVLRAEAGLEVKVRRCCTVPYCQGEALLCCAVQSASGVPRGVRQRGSLLTSVAPWVCLAVHAAPAARRGCVACRSTRVPVNSSPRVDASEASARPSH